MFKEWLGTRELKRAERLHRDRRYQQLPDGTYGRLKKGMVAGRGEPAINPSPSAPQVMPRASGYPLAVFHEPDIVYQGTMYRAKVTLGDPCSQCGTVHTSGAVTIIVTPKIPWAMVWSNGSVYTFSEETWRGYWEGLLR